MKPIVRFSLLLVMLSVISAAGKSAANDHVKPQLALGIDDTDVTKYGIRARVSGRLFDQAKFEARDLLGTFSEPASTKNSNFESESGGFNSILDPGYDTTAASAGGVRTTPIQMMWSWRNDICAGSDAGCVVEDRFASPRFHWLQSRSPEARCNQNDIVTQPAWVCANAAYGAAVAGGVLCNQRGVPPYWQANQREHGFYVSVEGSCFSAQNVCMNNGGLPTRGSGDPGGWCTEDTCTAHQANELGTICDMDVQWAAPANEVYMNVGVFIYPNGLVENAGAGAAFGVPAWRRPVVLNFAAAGDYFGYVPVKRYGNYTGRDASLHPLRASGADGTFTWYASGFPSGPGNYNPANAYHEYFGSYFRQGDDISFYADVRQMQIHSIDRNGVSTGNYGANAVAGCGQGPVYTGEVDGEGKPIYFDAAVPQCLRPKSYWNATKQKWVACNAYDTYLENGVTLNVDRDDNNIIYPGPPETRTCGAQVSGQPLRPFDSGGNGTGWSALRFDTFAMDTVNDKVDFALSGNEWRLELAMFWAFATECMVEVSYTSPACGGMPGYQVKRKWNMSTMMIRDVSLAGSVKLFNLDEHSCTATNGDCPPPNVPWGPANDNMVRPDRLHIGLNMPTVSLVMHPESAVGTTEWFGNRKSMRSIYGDLAGYGTSCFAIVYDECAFAMARFGNPDADGTNADPELILPQIVAALGDEFNTQFRDLIEGLVADLNQSLPAFSSLLGDPWNFGNSLIDVGIFLTGSSGDGIADPAEATRRIWPVPFEPAPPGLNTLININAALGFRPIAFEAPVPANKILKIDDPSDGISATSFFAVPTLVYPDTSSCQIEVKGVGATSVATAAGAANTWNQTGTAFAYANTTGWLTGLGVTPSGRNFKRAFFNRGNWTWGLIRDLHKNISNGGLGNMSPANAYKIETWRGGNPGGDGSFAASTAWGISDGWIKLTAPSQGSYANIRVGDQFFFDAYPDARYTIKALGTATNLAVQLDFAAAAANRTTPFRMDGSQAYTIISRSCSRTATEYPNETVGYDYGDYVIDRAWTDPKTGKSYSGRDVIQPYYMADANMQTAPSWCLTPSAAWTDRNDMATFYPMRTWLSFDNTYDTPPAGATALGMTMPGADQTLGSWDFIAPTSVGGPPVEQIVESDVVINSNAPVKGGWVSTTWGVATANAARALRAGNTTNDSLTSDFGTQAPTASYHVWVANSRVGIPYVPPQEQITSSDTVIDAAASSRGGWLSTTTNVSSANQGRALRSGLTPSDSHTSSFFTQSPSATYTVRLAHSRVEIPSSPAKEQLTSTDTAINAAATVQGNWTSSSSGVSGSNATRALVAGSTGTDSLTSAFTTFAPSATYNIKLAHSRVDISGAAAPEKEQISRSDSVIDANATSRGGWVFNTTVVNNSNQTRALVAGNTPNDSYTSTFDTVAASATYNIKVAHSRVDLVSAGTPAKDQITQSDTAINSNATSPGAWTLTTTNVGNSNQAQALIAGNTTDSFTSSFSTQAPSGTYTVHVAHSRVAIPAPPPGEQVTMSDTAIVANATSMGTWAATSPWAAANQNQVLAAGAAGVDTMLSGFATQSPSATFYVWVAFSRIKVGGGGGNPTVTLTVGIDGTNFGAIGSSTDDAWPSWVLVGTRTLTANLAHSLSLSCNSAGSANRRCGVDGILVTTDSAINPNTDSGFNTPSYTGANWDPLDYYTTGGGSAQNTQLIVSVDGVQVGGTLTQSVDNTWSWTALGTRSLSSGLHTITFSCSSGGISRCGVDGFVVTTESINPSTAAGFTPYMTADWDAAALTYYTPASGGGGATQNTQLVVKVGSTTVATLNQTAGDTWTWSNLTPITLTAGTHTLTFECTSGGDSRCGVDGVLITTETINPNTAGGFTPYTSANWDAAALNYYTPASGGADPRNITLEVIVDGTTSVGTLNQSTDNAWAWSTLTPAFLSAGSHTVTFKCTSAGTSRCAVDGLLITTEATDPGTAAGFTPYATANWDSVTLDFYEPPVSGSMQNTQLSLFIDGTQVGSTLTQNTGNSWSWANLGPVTLSGGSHTLRLQCSAGGLSRCGVDGILLTTEATDPAAGGFIPYTTANWDDPSLDFFSAGTGGPQDTLLTVKIDNTRVGSTLTQSQDDTWTWTYLGTRTLNAGAHTIKFECFSGGSSRCGVDGLLMTTQLTNPNTAAGFTPYTSANWDSNTLDTYSATSSALRGIVAAGQNDYRVKESASINYDASVHIHQRTLNQLAHAVVASGSACLEFAQTDRNTGERTPWADFMTTDRLAAFIPELSSMYRNAPVKLRIAPQRTPHIRTGIANLNGVPSSTMVGSAPIINEPYTIAAALPDLQLSIVVTDPESGSDITVFKMNWNTVVGLYLRAMRQCHALDKTVNTSPECTSLDPMVRTITGYWQLYVDYGNPELGAAFEPPANTVDGFQSGRFTRSNFVCPECSPSVPAGQAKFDVIESYCGEGCDKVGLAQALAVLLDSTFSLYLETRASTEFLSLPLNLDILYVGPDGPNDDGLGTSAVGSRGDYLGVYIRMFQKLDLMGLMAGLELAPARTFIPQATVPALSGVTYVNTNRPTFDAVLVGSSTASVGDGGLFTYRLDGGFWRTPRALPQIELGVLTEGKHRLELRGIADQPDGWYNQLTPTVLEFTVDSLAPQIKILPNKSGYYSGSAQLEIRDLQTPDNELFVEYALDGEKWKVLDGRSVSLSSLPNGRHTLRVRATDLAGNTGEAAREIVVHDGGNCGGCASGSDDSVVIVLLLMSIALIRRLSLRRTR